MNGISSIWTVPGARRVARPLAGALLALIAASPAALAQSTASGANSRAWLGFGIVCSECTLRYPQGDAANGRWEFSTPPVVAEVTPSGPAARAGLLVGDTITAIDGTPITSAEGGRRFAQVRAGHGVSFTWRRAGRTGISTVVPMTPGTVALVADRPTAYTEIVERMKDSVERAMVEEEAARALTNWRRAHDSEVAVAAKKEAIARKSTGVHVPEDSVRRVKELVQATVARQVNVERAVAVGSTQFTGSVAGADIEVRGTNVHVSSDEQAGTLIIRGDRLVVTVKPAGKSEQRR